MTEPRIICTGCWQDLSATEFNKRPDSKSGYETKCKACRMVSRNRNDMNAASRKGSVVTEDQSSWGMTVPQNTRAIKTFYRHAYKHKRYGGEFTNVAIIH